MINEVWYYAVRYIMTFEINDFHLRILYILYNITLLFFLIILRKYLCDIHILL